MRLIKNDKEREQSGLPPLHQLCGACKDGLYLHYPVLFVDDRNHTGYHLACAAKLATSIADAITDYLLEPPATQTEENEELSDMAKAFREAVKAHTKKSS